MCYQTSNKFHVVKVVLGTNLIKRLNTKIVLQKAEKIQKLVKKKWIN